jgi:ubiquinone/menaquinone biosynthesis C-methylase UbiE
MDMKTEDIRKYVRDRYAGIAKQGGSCCGPSACCGTSDPAEEASGRIGYSEAEMDAVPQGSNLGLGCGNPTGLASLKPGETVLDLGSGAGFDCFLAAREVGDKGHVIGVDLTPEMVEKARENARKGGYANVEFRLGEIENLPVRDGAVDVVLSNCVINLSTAKGKVFAEAYRVLKPGGRAMISDIVLRGELPESVAGSLAAYAGCVAGAIRKDEYLRLMEAGGFRDIQVVKESRFEIPEDELDTYARSIAGDLDAPREAVRQAAESIASVQVSGVKPS